MSHSTCLVIIDGSVSSASEAAATAEEMLAPFSEELEVEPYKRYEKGAPADFWLVRPLREEGALPDGDLSWLQVATAANARYPDDRYDVDNEGMYQMSTYNPRSKWDWYQLGGRWTGFFTVKAAVGSTAVLGEASWARADRPAEANTADLVRKSDIDFDIMRFDAEIAAEERFAHWVELLNSLTEIEREMRFTSWEGIVMSTEGSSRTPPGKPDYELARGLYGSQPVVKAMRDVRFRDHFGWSEGPEDFFCGLNVDDARKLFVERARNSTAVPFAVLDSEGWHESGKMGWWGIVSDEKDADEWNRSVAQLYDKLPDETWLLIYDLHI